MIDGRIPLRNLKQDNVEHGRLTSNLAAGAYFLNTSNQ
jgi:hypothetical protein